MWCLCFPPGPDYLDVIKKPIDLQHIKTGLKRGDYPNLDAFAADCHLVFDNAILCVLCPPSPPGTLPPATHLVHPPDQPPYVLHQRCGIGA